MWNRRVANTKIFLYDMSYVLLLTELFLQI
jgi:hypothetical protein